MILDKKVTLSNVKDMFYTVLDWNRTGGNLPSDKSLTKVYHQLTIAEFEGKGEFLPSYHSNDDEGIMDGIADMLYTGLFWAATEGMNESHLQSRYLEVEELDKDLEYCISLLTRALDRADSFMFVRYLILLLKIYETKYDLVSVFKEVSISNFSKYPKVEDVEDPEKELELILDKGRYVGLDYKEFEGRYIFTAMQDLQDDVRFDKPKIIKSSQFVEVPDLTQFIY
ncbi:nucleotide pyrophosphohydrolase [Vibrio phage K460]